MKPFVFTCCLLVLAPDVLLACRVKSVLDEQTKSKAEMVFIGKAIAYTPSSNNPRKPGSFKPAIIRFRVEKVLSGQKQDDVELYWVNGTFGESRSLEEFVKTYGERTRVGVTKGSAYKKFLDKPWVLQGPCTDPFMSPEK